MDLTSTDLLNSWLPDLLGIVRVLATILIIYYTYTWYLERFCSRYIKPSDHRDKQSIVLDASTGVRGSSLIDAFPSDDAIITYYDIFTTGMQLSRHKPCFGHRRSFDVPFEWLTYEEVDNRIRSVGAGFEYLWSDGTIATGNRMIGLYAKNSPEWMITLIACSAYSFVAIPMYETLGAEALQHVCCQVTPCVVVCDTVERAEKVILWCGDSLKCVVINADQEPIDAFRQRYTGLTSILSFDELMTIGRARPQHTKTPDAQDLFLIGYTSGSTGLPKGVMFTHENCVLATFCGVHILSEVQPIVDQVSHFSYLPLSHCYERINVTTFLYRGGKIGFLTADVSGLLQDLHDCKPFYFSTVPRVLMKVYAQVLQRVSSSKLLFALFRWAIRQKLEEQSRGFYRNAGLLDRLFFKPLRDKVGGNVQVVVSASAPISKEILSFTRAAFSCPVIECYGLTETSGLLSATLVGDMIPDHTGTPYMDFLVRLSDVPDMDIMVERDAMGEICVKGKGCTKGYYKDGASTQKLFDSTGFLRTGDIGTWTPQGSLQVVDRCKSFFKLAQGDYVTPKKIEELYSTSLLVNNVFVHGNSLCSYVVAVVEPNLAELRKRLLSTPNHQNGTLANGTVASSAEWILETANDLTDEELCRHPLAIQVVLQELTHIGKQGGLNALEQVKAIYLSAQPFTVDNGLLTPTMKISRPNVRRHFASVFKQLYNESSIR